MTRKHLVVAGLAVLVVAIGAAVLVSRPDPGPGLPKLAPDEAKAHADAEETCSLMREVEALVNANAGASTVLDTVARAGTAGRQAAARDVRWVSLSSGVESVHLGLRRDDSAAASVGIRIVRAQCQAVTGSPTP
ncbi:MAG TPA: hypothetical protein VFA94_11765 [Acidimicrobiales bacterium]|nr:hypothetical protein [Acidimicrobiales bacterium]